MEELVEKYCNEMMWLHGGTYEILSDVKMVAIYRADIQDLDVISFEDAVENLRELT